jgi:hypothetical protein
VKRSLMRSLVALTLLCALESSCASRLADKEATANMLGHEYETVFVADGTLLSSGLSHGRMAAMLVMPFRDLIEAINQSDVISRLNLFGGRTVEYAAVGAKDFRPPGTRDGLGDVLSDTCHVLKLTRSGVVDVQRLRPGTPVAGVRGPWAWSWKVHVNDPTAIMFYVSQPQSEYLLMGSDLKGLEKMHAWITSGPVRRRAAHGLVADLPIREEIRRSPLWGYRAFRHDSDISSQQSSGLLGVGPGARTLVFFTSPRADTGWLEYTCAKGSGDRFTRDPRITRLLTFRGLSETAWQASVPIGHSEDETDLERLFVVISMFGFGIAL